MIYLGSKAQIAKYLIPIFQNIIDKNNISTYIEPFVGGANVIDKIKCDNRIGYDLSRTLIALLRVARDECDKIPINGDKEWFNKAKSIYRGESDESMEDYLIGAIQWLGSYGTKGFQGGFANPCKGRDYYKERRNNLIKQSPNLKDIKFICADYKDIIIPDGALVYCDPPYRGTQTYDFIDKKQFNYEEYWNWVRQESSHAIILCSEENFPDDFTVIKEIPKRRGLKQDNNLIAVEKLGFYDKAYFRNLI